MSHKELDRLLIDLGGAPFLNLPSGRERDSQIEVRIFVFSRGDPMANDRWRVPCIGNLVATTTREQSDGNKNKTDWLHTGDTIACPTRLSEKDQRVKIGVIL